MSDPYVLEVQQWLNATYGAVPGFTAVPETGDTGWSTMYGLTEGLQHELGITELSTNFGSTTLSLLEAHGDIGPGETNSNIVRIVQGGLYCQGYNPYGFDGGYGPGCQAAVLAIQKDMGFGSSATTTVPPKVFKGLLTMNAYTLLANGSSEVREVQQWLNQEYIGRENFFIAPCDGLYSRDVQKNLVYALQYEIGMDDATANGNFGPGTKAGLKAQGLFSVGASDTTKNFVRLFTAGLIFNAVHVVFDSMFTAADSSLVQSFQNFCMLTANGDADYETWCSLLVSSGDPDRATAAVDTSTPLTAATAATLVGAGYTTVGRYLTNPAGGSLNKKIQDGELDIIFGAGLSVFAIYQTTGNLACYFNYGRGLSDGANAHVAAIGYGFRNDTVIYFGVDFDPTDAQINPCITEYFHGVRDAFEARGSAYRVGVYGTRNVCQQVSTTGYAGLSFVAGMSTGYSGNLGYTLPTNWAFDQIQEYTAGSGAGAIGLDKDVQSMRDLGASDTIPRTDPGINGTFYDALRVVSDMADEWVAEHGSPPDSGGLVCQWFRRNDYDSTAWDLLAGPIDDDFIVAVQARFDDLGIDEGARLYDPDCPDGDLGLPDSLDDGKIDSAHMMATVNAQGPGKVVG
jgi:peptidoglycan hydrolase-like protein with peptidoglycan-binding domain